MSPRPGDLQMSPRDRLLRRILVDLDGPRPVDDAPCWTWDGKLLPNGYGTYQDRPAHRVVFEQLAAPVAEDLDLDHLCRNHQCVNPAHLEPVTHAENCRRGVAGEVNRARMLAKTHCARGHEWTPENTKQTGRQRKCRACIREDSAKAHAHRRAGAS